MKTSYEQRIKEEFERSLQDKWTEISAEDYESALEVLPPIKYRNGGFFTAEAFQSCIYPYYQELEGKYYTSLQDIFRPREVILDSLKSAFGDIRR